MRYTAFLLVSSFFPPEASDVAHRVDRAFLILLALSAAIVGLVAALVLYFGIRYRRAAMRGTSGKLPRRERQWVEIAWATVLVVGSIGLFVLGGWALLTPSMQPRGGAPIYVVGKQWMWKVQHPEGRQEINSLHVPLGAPIRLVMSSQDVIHSFYVPAFRLKQDVLPERFTTMSFTPTREGEFDLYCAEYCGTEHSNMVGRVVVLPPRAYEQWLEGVDPDRKPSATRDYTPMSTAGESAFTRFGCAACHGEAATPSAPRLDGVYMRQTRLRSGRLVIADEHYLRESILRPSAKIVAGYPSPSPMPTFEGKISEEELDQLIEYIRSIRYGQGGEGEQAPQEQEATP